MVIIKWLSLQTLDLITYTVTSGKLYGLTDGCDLNISFPHFVLLRKNPLKPSKENYTTVMTGSGAV